MKFAGLLSIIVVAVCLVGCENQELITCQQEKNLLTGQLNEAQTAIAEKETEIKQLEAKNVEDQTKAMESITTMMQKQAAVDEKRKKELADTKEELKKVKSELAIKETEFKNLKEIHEKTVQSLEALEKEKQALTNKINEIQKAAIAPAKTE
jgi:chromosome segregation ATPase